MPAPATCTPRCRESRRLACACIDSVGEFIAVALDGGSGVQRLRQTEVEHLHRPVGPHLDIGGFQIAMDDALFMRRFERFRNLSRDRQRFVERNGPRAISTDRSSPSTSSITRARTAVRIPRCRDVPMFGMVQRRECLRFARESRQAIGIIRDDSGRILSATSRFSLVSRARYTSPMPPAPSSASTS